MNKRVSAPARALATIALVCGVLVLVVVIVSSLSDDGGNGSGTRPSSAGQAREGGDERATPESYVVQSGDTLTSIAHRTGVSVALIRRLNPGVDPQILISGEKLKLR